jgi:hypothetical protein
MRTLLVFALIAVLAACKPSAPPPQATAKGAQTAAPAGQKPAPEAPKAAPAGQKPAPVAQKSAPGTPGPGAAPAATPPASDAQPGHVPVPDDFRPPTLGAEVEGGSPTTDAAQTLALGEWSIAHRFSSGVATHTKSGRTVPLWAARGDCTGYSFEAGLGSVVGTRVTYKFSERGTCPGAPSRGDGFETVDIATGKPVMLTSLFDTAEIDAALNGDSWLTNARAKPGIFKCLYREDALKTNHFAFQSVSSGRVVVRLGLGHGCDSHKGLFTQIDLTLTPKPAVLAEVEAAKARGTLGEHLLLALIAPPKKE